MLNVSNALKVKAHEWEHQTSDLESCRHRDGLQRRGSGPYRAYGSLVSNVQHRDERQNRDANSNLVAAVGKRCQMMKWNMFHTIHSVESNRVMRERRIQYKLQWNYIEIIDLICPEWPIINLYVK